MAKDALFLHVDNEDSDQTALMHISEGTFSHVVVKIILPFPENMQRGRGSKVLFKNLAI